VSLGSVKIKAAQGLNVALTLFPAQFRPRRPRLGNLLEVALG
jgi:hypothetical protein